MRPEKDAELPELVSQPRLPVCRHEHVGEAASPLLREELFLR
jgi:hypothetical protein